MNAYDHFKAILDVWPPFLGVLHTKPPEQNTRLVIKIFKFLFVAIVFLPFLLFFNTILFYDDEMVLRTVALFGISLEVS